MSILQGAADLLTPEEVASYLSIHKNTVYSLCKSGDLPSFKVGNNRRIRTEALRKFIESQEGEAETNA